MSQKLPADTVELRDMVLAALAEVRGCPPSELVNEDGQPDKVEMTAKETMAVAAAVEDVTGKPNLVTPDDFSTPTTRDNDKSGRDVSPSGCMDPGEGATVKGMIDLLSRRLGLSR